jgi:hypothetical protein
MLVDILHQKVIGVVMVEVIMLTFVMAVVVEVPAQLEQTVFKTQVLVKDLVEMVL